MFEVILSVIGLGFAAWTLLPESKRIQVRAKRATCERRLREIGASCVVIVFTVAFVMPFIPESCDALAGFLLAIGQVSIVTFFGWAAHLVWPDGAWDRRQLEFFRTEMQSLISSGRADVVAEILDQAFPEIPSRRVLHEGEVPRRPTDFEKFFDELLEDALVHPEFITSTVQYHCSLAIKLLCTQSAAGMYASGRILDELMFGSGKVLVRELEQSTSYGDDIRHFYRIPDRCKVLHALLDDVGVGIRISCWKPIGEGVIRHIASQIDKPSIDPDQRPFVEKYEDRRWSSPVGSGIWFFRVMCTSAVKQGETWHMWLPYLRHFVDHMQQVVRIPQQSAHDKFPNAYCYWIYDCCSCCGDVVAMIPRLQEDNPNRPNAATIQRDSVTSWAIRTYGDCLVKLLESSHLTDHFKRDRLDDFCSSYQSWTSAEYPDAMSQFVAYHLNQYLTDRQKQILADGIQASTRRDHTNDAATNLVGELLGRGAP